MLNRSLGFILLTMAGTGTVSAHTSLHAVAPMSQVQDGRRVRDSAGIEIVEFDSIPAARIPFRLGAVALTIGRRYGQPASDHSRAVDAMRLSDGRILAFSGRGGEVRVFDSTGLFQGNLGTRAVYHACELRADTLVVLQSLAELSLLGPGGRTLASAHVASNTKPLCSSTGSIFLQIPSPFEWAVRTNATRAAPVNREIRRTDFTLQHVRLSAGSRLAVIHDLGRVSGDDVYQLLALRSNATLPSFVARWAERPFGRKTSVAVDGDRLHVGDGSTFEVRTLASDGRVVRILRVFSQPQLMTASLRMAWADENFANKSAGSRQQHDEQYRIADAEVFPATVPSYRQLKVDRAGRLWVHRYPIPNSQTQMWFVFSGDARLLGSVTLPVDFTVTEFGVDYVLGNTLLDKGRLPTSDAYNGVPADYEVRMYKLTTGG